MTPTRLQSVTLAERLAKAAAGLKHFEHGYYGSFIASDEHDAASLAALLEEAAAALSAQGEPVAWVCTRRTSGDKAVFAEPCIAMNPAYVKAHPHHDWRPLFAAPHQDTTPQPQEGG